MAVVLIEGFDHFAASDSGSKGWSANPDSMQTGRVDGQCARLSGSNAQAIYKTLPSSYATLFVGFAFKYSTVPAATRDIFVLRSGTTATVRIGLSAAQKLVVRNAGATTIYTGSLTMNTNTWYFIEVKAVVAGASGTVQAKINATADIASQTINIGTANIDNLGPYTADNAHGLGNRDYDDIYAVDTTGAARNDFLGSVRVQTLYPTANSAVNQGWSSSSGAAYTTIDDATPDGDTTYIEAGTASTKSTFAFGDLTATSGTIYGVQTNMYARAVDAGTRTLTPVIRISSTDYDGTATPGIGVSYSYYTQIYNQDPASADWSITTVNNAEYGVKIVT